VIDSFQTIMRPQAHTAEPQMSLQYFVQRLAIHLTSWQATTFLIGDSMEDELHGNPVFTVADGILQLTQVSARNSSVRKLHVVKSRGQAPMPGLHTFRITTTGLQIFPRITGPDEAARAPGSARPAKNRLTSGVPGLDTLMGGGIPFGDALLITGPSGTGKSALATQFIAAGAATGEAGVIAVFEEHPQEYLRRAETFGLDLEALERQGTLEIIYIRPLDLSPDETLHEIREAVRRVGAQRVVIDSISGFELALAPNFREDFRESFYRLVGALTGTGVTVLLTMEIPQSEAGLRFSPYVVSFLADDIVLLRYDERTEEIRKTLTVVKMRNSDHSKERWFYEITGQGLLVRESLAASSSGPDSRNQRGLTDSETVVLRALIELGEVPLPALQQRTGLAEADLLAALDRLVTLTYSIRVTGDSYRAVAQPLHEAEGRG
jgi:circadian clock protein KaiC